MELLTIGYQRRSVGSCLRMLLWSRVTLLCDVRRNPVSRKRGFSRRALAASCAACGIRYVHLPELGVPPAQRRNLRSSADYDAMMRRYAASLDGCRTVLRRILRWINEGERVVLLCFERMPAHCHRQCVAQMLARMSSGAVRVRHIV